MKYELPLVRNRDCRCPTVVMMGPGGHAAEMLLLLAKIPLAMITPTYYVFADIGKRPGMKKVNLFEKKRSRGSCKAERRKHVDYHFCVLRSARKPAAPLWTAVLPTLASFFECTRLMLRIRPKLVLCNGPGFCLCVCYVNYLLEV